MLFITRTHVCDVMCLTNKANGTWTSTPRSDMKAGKPCPVRVRLCPVFPSSRDMKYVKCDKLIHDNLDTNYNTMIMTASTISQITRNMT